MLRQCAIAAGVLLALGFGRVNWYWFRGVAQWWVWDASQALLLAGAFTIFALKTANDALRPVLALGVAINLLTAFAGLWWAFSPVQPEPGHESFDKIIGWPASLLFLLLFVIAALSVTKARENNKGGHHDTAE
jgi:hypothetical protein